MRLSMICPSRGRPDNIRDLWRAWQETASVADLWVVLDADDPEGHRYPGGPLYAVVQTRGMVEAINATAENLVAVAAHYDAVGFLGDDHRPRTPGWDVRLLDELERLGTGFVYGNDLLQGERIPTAIAMTSDIVQTLGYMAPPSLSHLNVDIAWLEWGRRIERIRYLDDVIIEHVHPAAGKAKLDAGYERVNSEEMVARDGEAWEAYRSGDLERDVDKLRALL